jgi:hypothetical protein
MSASLRAFVTKALELNRISFGDLRRLQRTVLPHGLVTREQAEVLIALEQNLAKKRPGRCVVQRGQALGCREGLCGAAKALDCGAHLTAGWGAAVVWPRTSKH